MKYSNELKVGATLLVSVIIFFVGLRFLQNTPLFQGSYVLETHLQDSAGLTAGNDVQISGVKVGSVDAVRLRADNQAAIVRFSVFEDVVIPEGSTARVSGLGALGGLRLAIEPGPPDNPRLPPGSVIPSQESPDLFETVGERTPVLLARADSMLQQASVTLADASVLMRGTQTEVQQTLASLRGTADTLTRLLAAEEERLGHVLANADTISTHLSRFTAQNADSLTVAAAQINQTLRRLDRNLQNMEGVTQRLNTLTASIDEGDGSLGRLVHDPSLYVQLDSLTVRMNEILEDLHRHPGRYLRDMTLLKLF